MSLPRNYEGGEVLDFVRDVRFARKIVDDVTARHAARTAMRYAFHAEELPFAKIAREDRDSSRIVDVGIYSPLNYSNHRDTIIGNNSEVNRSRSFVTAVKSLFRASGADFTDATNVTIMVDLDGTDIPVHPDTHSNSSRSFLQLDGFRMLEFEPVPLEVAPPYSIGCLLSPGDYYSMDFRTDETSIRHGAEYYGSPYCVGIYIDHETVV